jgi:uncharacterized protein YecT (DUF1311 family)
MGAMQPKHSIQTRLFFLAGLVSFTTYSVGQHMNAKDAPCQGPSSNAEQTQCFFSASRNADADMNQTYKQVRKVLGAEEQIQLQSAQRLWLQFRNANCAAERDLYAGGTAAPMVYAACIEADTRQRTAELNTMYGWCLIKFNGSSR